MSASLYNADILRLAANIPHHARLADAQASAERRSAVCGSRVTADVRLGDDGRIAALGLEVRACALGQAAASLMAAHAIGCSVPEMVDARDRLAAFLSGAGGALDFWPGLDILAPAQAYPGRHASIRLAFEAAAEAAEKAGGHA